MSLILPDNGLLFSEDLALRLFMQCRICPLKFMLKLE